ncbi:MULTISPECIES: DUF418 domain-containing protein [unclassified Nocardiopsis]|uniref:DUF418 domain-containing protein n=1 Tax=Nocardiopsis TaxID=2013 RepID=UPI00387B7478
MASHTPRHRTGPAPADTPGPAQRSLAPDLARGFMLLFIALVNAGFFLTGPDTVRALANEVVTFVQLTLVNGRAIPLFALLFGYGAVMIMRRVRASGGGWVQARILLRRRGWVLLALGAAHGILLLPVDILGAYGLALLLFVGLVRARDVTLWWTAGVLAAVSVAAHTAWVLSIPVDGADDGGGAAAVPSLVEPSFVAATVERFNEWTLYTPVTMLLVAMPMIVLGFWAGHRRLLEEPRAHLPLLRSAAAWGLGIGVLTGLPNALVAAGWAAAGPRLDGALAVLHDLGGWAGGIGWAALIALLATRWESRPTRTPASTGIPASAVPTDASSPTDLIAGSSHTDTSADTGTPVATDPTHTPAPAGPTSTSSPTGTPVATDPTHTPAPTGTSVPTAPTPTAPVSTGQRTPAPPAPTASTAPPATAEQRTSAPPAAGPVVTAVAAVGERSLSCYLLQSLVFTAVFAPYGLGLGASLGAAGAAAVAVATWLASVAAAEALRRADRRGPAEVLMRRLIRRREPLPRTP